jgi:hypothetical protein
MDSRQLRNYVKSMQPDINMETTITDSEGAEFTMEIPFTLNFFWPDVEL